LLLDRRDFHVVFPHNEVSLRSLQHQVVVVLHEDPGRAADVVVFDHLGHGADEPLPIGIIADDGLAVIAPRCHMVDGKAVVDKHGPGHGQSLEP